MSTRKDLPASRRFRFVFATIIIATGVSCKQAQLTGSWRRMDKGFERETIYKKEPRSGDLILRADSTFIIQGDTIGQQSSVPGWHVDDTYTGSWDQRRKGYLFLRLEPKEQMMVLGFKLVRLTRKRLVLKSSSYKQHYRNVAYLQAGK
jgi:hypothetical protein